MEYCHLLFETFIFLFITLHTPACNAQTVPDPSSQNTWSTVGQIRNARSLAKATFVDGLVANLTVPELGLSILNE